MKISEKKEGTSQRTELNKHRHLNKSLGLGKRAKTNIRYLEFKSTCIYVYLDSKNWKKTLVPGYVSSCERFHMRSLASKQDFLVDLETNGRGKEAAALVEDCGMTEDLSVEIAKIIDNYCLDSCQYYKRRIENNFFEFVSEAEVLIAQTGKKTDKLKKRLEKASNVITELGKIPTQFQDTSQDPSKLIKDAEQKLDSALKHNLITKEQHEVMLGKTKDAFAFDPVIRTSFTEVVNNVQKGLVL